MVYLEIQWEEDSDPSADHGLVKVDSLPEAMVWLDAAEYKVAGYLCSDKPINYPESYYSGVSKETNAALRRALKE